MRAPRRIHWVSLSGRKLSARASTVFGIAKFSAKAEIQAPDGCSSEPKEGCKNDKSPVLGPLSFVIFLREFVMVPHPILSWQIMPEVIQICMGDVHIDAASIAVLMLLLTIIRTRH